jgi:hypothetical protein
MISSELRLSIAVIRQRMALAPLITELRDLVSAGTMGPSVAARVATISRSRQRSMLRIFERIRANRPAARMTMTWVHPYLQQEVEAAQESLPIAEALRTPQDGDRVRSANSSDGHWVVANEQDDVDRVAVLALTYENTGVAYRYVSLADYGTLRREANAALLNVQRLELEARVAVATHQIATPVPETMTISDLAALESWPAVVRLLQAAITAVPPEASDVSDQVAAGLYYALSIAMPMTANPDHVPVQVPRRPRPARTRVVTPPPAATVDF